MKYTITGATGHLGSQITKQLHQLVPADQINLGVHTPAKAQHFADLGMTLHAIDYADEASLITALQNSDVFIYVPSKSHDSYSRVTELEHVIAAAEQAHVQKMVAMGFVADQTDNPFTLSAFYGYLPRRLAETDLDYVILRNVLYADPLVPYLPELIERGNIIYPVGHHAMSFISLADSAEAFAKVATTPALFRRKKSYTLSQSRDYTMPQLAEVLSKVSGHHIGYAPVTNAEFEQLYDQNHEGKMLASMYAGGAMGLLDDLSDDFEQITGHPAQTMTAFLTKQWQQKGL
ncbi:NAD(P)H-binding protein [Lactobacillus selangorensis]|nr:NAD(P)H-binding protein [Lactobacillus selangorensis]